MRTVILRALLPVLPVLACSACANASYDAMRADLGRGIEGRERGNSIDEAAMSGAVLDRPVFVRAVLDRNPSIESARQAWRASLAHVRQQRSLDDPMVNIEIAPLSVASATARFGFTASVSQRIPWPGKLSLDESAATWDARAAKSDFEQTSRDLALGAALLYDDYFVAVRSLEINAEHIALMRALQAGAVAQLESGRASLQDPLQAEAELTHMEHDAIVLESERAVIVAQMNELLHRAPDVALPPPVKDLALPPSPELAGDRADIEASRSRARAEGMRADRARREWIPDLVLSTSYNSMWDMPEHRWMVGIGVNVPLPYSRRPGAIEEADAARSKWESDAIRLADKARTEVAVASKRMEEARHVVALIETRLIPVARKQIDAARAGFTSSRNEFVAVIVAEKNLRSVELELHVARANVDRRAAELDHAVGRTAGVGKDGAR